MKNFISLLLLAPVFTFAAPELKIEKHQVTVKSDGKSSWKSGILVPCMTIGPKGKIQK